MAGCRPETRCRKQVADRRDHRAGFEHGAVAFFKLAGGLILALWPSASLAEEARIAVTDRPLGAVSIGHNVGSKAEVDAVMRQAELAGAIVTDPARDRFWGGYAGHFHDPDGHLWEVAWNPEWLEADSA